RLERVGIRLCRVDLEIELATGPASLCWLVHDCNRRTGRDLVVKPGNVFGVKANTAVAVAPTDAVGLVGPVDGISLPAEIERKIPHRVVGARPNREGQIRIFLVL